MSGQSKGARPRFRYEAQLVERGKELLPSFLAGSGRTWRMTAELTVGVAIADLVLALIPRRGRSVPVLSAQESVILAALRNLRVARVDRLEQACGLVPGSLRQGALDPLIEARLITRRGGGHIEARSDWATSADVVAVEAKLVRWQEAVRQAITYTQYANRVYVMLPDRALERCTERCTALGVGLLVVTDAGLEERVPAMVRSSGHGWRREYALSRVLARA